jgi:hypothetical protein
VKEPNHTFYGESAMELALREAREDLAGVSGSPVVCAGQIVGIISAQLKTWGAAGAVAPRYQRLYAFPLEEIGWPELPIARRIIPGPAPALRDLDRLRRRVRDTWIDGVLQGATAGLAAFRVDRASRTDLATARPVPGRWAPGGPIPAARSQSSLFEQSNGALLLLGAPGAGKTVALLELARDLLDTSEVDPEAPVPVIFALSAWDGERLDVWLVEELRRRYQIPVALGQSWLKARRITPLFDGLDEVVAARRAACVTAFNHLRDEDGLLGVAITCRREEYDGLDVRLNVALVVELLPLSDEAVAAWVDAAGERLRGLRDALAARSELRELSRTPLFLNLLAVTTDNRSADKLAPEGGELSRQLIAAWIDRVYEDRTVGFRFDRRRTESALRWLAARMAERGQTLIQVDDLQPELLGSAGRAIWMGVTRGWVAVGMATSGSLLLLGLLASLLGGSGAILALLFLWLLYPVWIATSAFGMSLGRLPLMRALPTATRRGAFVRGTLTTLAPSLVLTPVAIDSDVGNPTDLDLWVFVAISCWSLLAGAVAAGPAPTRPWVDIAVTSEVVPQWRKASLVLSAAALAALAVWGIRYAQYDEATPYLDVVSGRVTSIGVETAGSQRLWLSEDGRYVAVWTRDEEGILLAMPSGRQVGHFRLPPIHVERLWLADDGSAWTASSDPPLPPGACASADGTCEGEDWSEFLQDSQDVYWWPDFAGGADAQRVPEGRALLQVVGSTALLRIGDHLELRGPAAPVRLGWAAEDGTTSLVAAPEGVYVAHAQLDQVELHGPDASVLSLPIAGAVAVARAEAAWLILDTKGDVSRWSTAGAPFGVALPTGVARGSGASGPGPEAAPSGASASVATPRRPAPRLIASPTGAFVVVSPEGRISGFDEADEPLSRLASLSDRTVVDARFAPDGAGLLIAFIQEQEAGLLLMDRGGATTLEVRVEQLHTTGGCSSPAPTFALPQSGRAEVVTYGGEDQRSSALFPLFLGTLFSLFVGFRRGVPREVGSANSRLLGALRNATVVALGVFVAVTTTVVAFTGELGNFRDVLLLGLPSAGIAALWFGGYALLQHALLRLLLAATSPLPLRLVRLLDEATSRAFLRRVGGQYLFLHRRVLEHFAEQAQEPPSRPAAPVAQGPGPSPS